MKKKWTEGFGKQIATLSTMYGLISDIWSAMGIGPGIVSWLKTENGKRYLITVVRSLGEKFLATQAESLMECDPIIDCSRIFDIFEYINKDPDRCYSVDYSKTDNRSLAFKNLRASSLVFETGLQEDELCINGLEKIQRLRLKEDIILLGLNVFSGLLFDYVEKLDDSILEFLYITKGITYIDFPGVLIRCEKGNHPYILSLRRHSMDGNWDWSLGWATQKIYDNKKLSACLQIGTHI